MIEISGRRIGPDQPPFIVAEMSGNHNRSLDAALAIVAAADEAGVHAVKIQTYTADTMTIDEQGADFTIGDSGSPWRGETLYELYRKAATPWEWHRPIIDACRKLGLLCFSTAFDETAVDFLETLDVPCYKIASFENTHLPLIQRVARTGKPMLISTGMASLAEIEEMVGAARGSGCRDLVLLKCTSSYPASPADANLRTIPHLRELFGCEVGISDHSLGIGVALAGVAIGASVIEKHLTISRADGGVDAAFSLEPHEMKILAGESLNAWRSLGNVQYGPTEAEKPSLKFRRSIYVVRDVKAGEPFTADNLGIIRPGFGLPPKHFDALLGKRASRDVKRGTPFSWDLL